MITFTVFGKPEPQGSTRAFIKKGMRFPVVVSDNTKLKPWRQQISGTAQAEMQRLGLQMIDKKHAVSVRAKFFFPPLSSGKKNQLYKITKPDLDKLLRALCDALAGIVFKDDSQVCYSAVGKYFGEPARLEVTVQVAP